MTVLAPADARISLASPLVPETSLAAEGPEAPALAVPWDRILEELKRLRRLENDWDGQGALALDPALVEQARAWVEDMRRWQGALPPTNVLPGTLGEIVLEWRGEGFHLAAELSTTSQVEWLLNLPGQPIKQWETDSQFPWIVRGKR